MDFVPETSYFPEGEVNGESSAESQEGENVTFLTYEIDDY